MQMTQKMKSLLVIIVFITLLVLPVCYALIRDRLFSHTEVKKDIPHTGYIAK